MCGVSANGGLVRVLRTARWGRDQLEGKIRCAYRVGGVQDGRLRGPGGVRPRTGESAVRGRQQNEWDVGVEFSEAHLVYLDTCGAGRRRERSVPSGRPFPSL